MGHFNKESSLTHRILRAMLLRMLPLMLIFTGFNFFMINQLQNRKLVNESTEIEVMTQQAHIILLGAAIVWILLEFLLVHDVLNKKVNSRLKVLIDASRKAKKGNLSVRVEDKESDEIGELANSFNQMTKFIELKMTDLKEKNRQYEEASDRAFQASQAKSQFLANMSHEIRTPMNGIIGIARMLENTKLDPQQREYIEIIQSSSQSLLALINDILDLSKIEAGKMELETIEFDLKSTIDNTLGTLKYAASTKGLELKLKINSELEHALIGDPNRIRQILLNLIGNAIKFTEKGVITLNVEINPSSDTASSDIENIYMEVVDQGIGIPEAKIQNLFTSFTQVDTATNRKFGGTGLGLSICKKLIELMSGTIGVQSKLGEGSKFWFHIHLKKGRDLNTLNTYYEDQELVQEFPHEKIKVLVAEDNIVNQIVAKNIIERLGYDVQVADNGVQAIHILRNDPDLKIIFMDCQMPELDGFEATKIIRSDPTERISGVPIIALTANAMNDDKNSCYQAGMDDFISKPIDPQVLEKKLKDWSLKIKKAA